MSEHEYLLALKQGQKEYRACVSKGQYPYLPVLDTIVPPEKQMNPIDLGIVQIPVGFIVGTKGSGRTNAFARNFMPILDFRSEFGAKWSNLSDSHLSEGIREPIKAYEYMNRYYIEEGNKRVSVLKHFGAVAIPGHVYRIMPQDDGSADVALYHEFVRFNRLSGLNDLEFSQPGCYDELCRLLGKDEFETWHVEERNRFRAFYFSFEAALKASTPALPGMTVADAMIRCLRIFGYTEMKAMSQSELIATILKTKEELALADKSNPIEILTTPDEEKKPGFFSRVKSTKPLKVVFLHDKAPETSGWTYGHELGRNHVQELFGSALSSSSVFDVMDKDPLAVIEEAIADGNQVIFTTSPRLLPASLRAAVDHPEVIIMNCSLNIGHRYVRTYYARMFEAKFIIGTIAGALAGSNPVGYICDYPIYGQIAGINAFALGVQMVNPTCKVYLEWSSVGEPGDALKRLRDRGIRLISSQDMSALRRKQGTSFGLSLITDDNEIQLARPVWHWGNYYEALLRRIQSKSLQNDFKDTDLAVNYYWGMSANVVQVECSEYVPTSTVKTTDFLSSMIRNRFCSPFRLPIYTQDNHVIDREDHFIPLDEIITMDWLNENIVGSIPAYDELSEVGRATVDQVGINAVWSAGKEDAP